MQGRPTGTLFLVTRFVEGEDLKTRVDRDGPMGPAVAVALVTQIGSALDAAYAKGLVHRDVKPGNVLISSSGECYLSDFGLTKPIVAERRLTESGQFVGARLRGAGACGRPGSGRGYAASAWTLRLGTLRKCASSAAPTSTGKAR